MIFEQYLLNSAGQHQSRFLQWGFAGKRLITTSAEILLHCFFWRFIIRPVKETLLSPTLLAVRDDGFKSEEICCWISRRSLFELSFEMGEKGGLIYIRADFCQSTIFMCICVENRGGTVVGGRKMPALIFISNALFPVAWFLTNVPFL